MLVAIWQAVQGAGALFFVAFPYAMQARESWRPPMGTPSLGTFGIVMMASFYFIVVGLINGILFASFRHWGVLASIGVGIVAAAVGAIASYAVLLKMASTGGKVWTIAGGVVLATLTAVNIGATGVATEKVSRSSGVTP